MRSCRPLIFWVQNTTHSFPSRVCDCDKIVKSEVNQWVCVCVFSSFSFLKRIGGWQSNTSYSICSSVWRLLKWIYRNRFERGSHAIGRWGMCDVRAEVEGALSWDFRLFEWPASRFYLFSRSRTLRIECVCLTVTPWNVMLIITHYQKKPEKIFNQARAKIKRFNVFLRYNYTWNL